MQPPSLIHARTSWVVLAAALSCSNAAPTRTIRSVTRPVARVSTPVLVRAQTPPPSPAAASRETLASSCARSCALSADGASVWCWAQVAAAPSALQPTALPNLTDARSLACGANHCCALRVGGAVSCWGIPASARRPTALSTLTLPDGEAVVSLDGGGARTCAALRSGRVVCWRLLDLGTSAFSPPQLVEGVEGARAVTVGGGHACALLRDGHVRCWGANRDGQSGAERTAAGRDVRPTEVADLPLVVELSSGDRHTCARTESGEVWCWGSNANGQLGCGPFAGGPRPQRVIDLTGVETIAAGRAHACAVLPGGAVACWGDNRTHAVGAIDPRTAPVPVAIPGVAGATRVSAACESSCARRGDGTVVCWGGRYRERGAPPGRPVPVALR